MTNGNIFWFTGLSGVGKSTIANAAKLKLELIISKVYLLL